MERVPPGQKVIDYFPVFSFAGNPEIKKEEWRLIIDGSVENPITLDWNSLINLGTENLIIDFHCVTHWSILDMNWTGVPTKKIIDLVKPKKTAKAILAHSFDNYTTNLLISDFSHKDCIIATGFNSKDLDIEHGYPARLLIPHLYAWKSAKWLKRLEFLDIEELGFWEINGYHRRGDPFKEQRYK